MKNILYLTVILSLFATTANAQQIGYSSMPNFNTDATGGQVGHLQSGAFGNVLGSGKWIGIGQPNVGPTAYGMRIQDGNRFCTLDILNGQSEIFWGGGSNNYLNFNYAPNGTSSPVQYMSIRNNGKVIIGDLNNVGTSTSNAALTVVETATSGGLGIEIEATTNRNPNLAFSINNVYRANIRVLDNAGDRLDFQVGTPLFTAMTILQNGDIGIGTSNPSCKLEVNGNACITGSLSVSSDERFKKNIERVEDPISLLKGLNGMTYEYNQSAFPDKEFTKGKTIGFIAQDFEKDLPELIRKDNEGYYSVNYLGVIPILVEAMKQVNSENEDLRVMNDNLANEMAELKALVTDLIKAQDVSNTVNAEKQALNNLNNNKSVLFQNTPNPSDGITKIAYEVDNKNASVSIIMNDLNGSEITRFDNLPTGSQSVDLVKDLESGIYLYTLYVDGIVIDTKRLVINK